MAFMCGEIGMKLKAYEILAFATFVLGCSQSSHPDHDQNVVLDKYGASCQYKNSDGDNINPLLLPNGPAVSYAAFDKPFDVNLVTPILKASAINTVTYINKTGVQIYGAEIKGPGCNFHGTLQTMPTDIQAHWSQATSEDTSTSRTMGLYLSKESDPEIASLKVKSAIIVRLNSARWTLIHEFMHHLFNAEYIDKHINLQQLRSDLIAALKAIDQKPESFDDSSQATRSYVAAWENGVALFDTINRAFPLEEVAVEDQLAKFYEAGQLQAVAEDEAKNGQWYMQERASFYIKRVNDLLEKIDKISTQMQAGNAWSLREECGASVKN